MFADEPVDAAANRKSFAAFGNLVKSIENNDASPLLEILLDQLAQTLDVGFLSL